MLARITFAAFALGLTVAPTAFAQWRDNQPAVIASQPQQTTSAPDYVGSFRKKYESVGSPRIVLFWNVSFDDQIESTKERIDTTNSKSAKKYSSSQESAAGEAGDATIWDGDESSAESTTRRQTERLVDTAQRVDSLSEKTRLQLQAAFGKILGEGRVVLLDRAMLMRATVVENQSAVLDAKQIEARALTDRADFLLEVLLVADNDSPLGYGFKVSVKDVMQGSELLSLYTRAMPQVAKAPGRYVATDHGFERKQADVAPLTAGDIGTQLAIEVMQSLEKFL